jgi:hypothetical protein
LNGIGIGIGIGKEHHWPYHAETQGLYIRTCVLNLNHPRMIKTFSCFFLGNHATA